MELTDSPSHSCGGITNFFSGATIHNLVINSGSYTHSGTTTNNLQYRVEPQGVQPYSDEQIARAIMAVSGEGKPLSLQKHYVGIICALQSMGWSRKFSTCCDRINQLPGHEQFPVKCTPSAIRTTQALRFAAVDYQKWDEYRPSPGEENGVFNECKSVAKAFVKALCNSTE